MRTIKFRAQDIASNKWLFGDIRHHKNDVCIFEQGGNKGEQVKPETVGQFTGLFDEDGREIYEGDIIKIVEKFDDEMSMAALVSYALKKGYTSCRTASISPTWVG